MKVYGDSNIVRCFSGNCEHSGKTIDQIDYIMYREGISKHQAIVKAAALAGLSQESVQEEKERKAPVALTLEEVFAYMQNGFRRTRSAEEYAAKRGLDSQQLTLGYNSGQIHHRRTAEYLADLEALGIIQLRAIGGYSLFAKDCLIFPLKDSTGRVCSLYGRKISGKGHYYLRGRSGLYPGYPPRDTKRIILTESIIDAATLMTIKELEGYFILALYGTNGLTGEHREALKALPQLEELIIILDGDEAGQKAASQYQSELQGLFSSTELGSVEVKKVELPQGSDVNELWVHHNSPQLFVELIEGLNPLIDSNLPMPQKSLDKSEAANLKYFSSSARYYVKGFANALSKGLDSLKITLVTENQSGRNFRSRVELYEDRDLRKYAAAAAERLSLSEEAILLDISDLSNALELHRQELLAARQGSKALRLPLPPEAVAEAQAFAAAPDLYARLNARLGATGIVGEEETRFLLFAVATSYIQEKPLHVLIQGSSGSGKTLLLRGIMSLIPEEKAKTYTRITEKSLYHTGQKLRHSTVAIEDWDGLPEEVQYIFREFQSGGGLSSLSTVKDESGESDSKDILALGPIASLMCTTKGAVYEDNMSRCFLVAVDESKEQTERVLDYQNARRRGDIDKAAEEEAKTLLRHFVEVLQPCPIINPFAGGVKLPDKAHKIRRLNELYLVFVEQIAWLHQFQRERDEKGRLIVSKEDLKLACELLFETIILKVDELDGALRVFFEKLKAYVTKKGGPQESFTQREIRLALNFTKVRLHNYIQELLELEYIQICGGYANKGYLYKISYWDDNQRLRREIKAFLEEQLSRI